MKRIFLFVGLFTCGSFAYANPALIQEKMATGTVSQTNVTITFPSPTIAGNSIIASTFYSPSVVWNKTGGCHITDDKGNAYIPGPQTSTSISNTFSVAILTSTSAIAGVTAISFNCTTISASGAEFYASEWSNVPSAVDVSTQQFLTSGIPVGIGVTPTTTNGIIYCHSRVFSSFPTGVGAPWLGFADDTTAWEISYLINPGAGGPFKPTLTTSTQNYLSACISLPGVSAYIPQTQFSIQGGRMFIQGGKVANK